MSNKNTEYKSIRILTLDGSDIYRDMKGGHSLTARDSRGRLDERRFRGVLDASMDTDHLQLIFSQYKDQLPFKFLINKEFTLSLINVTFDFSVKEFYNKGKHLFIRDGYDVDRGQLVDHTYIAEVDGKEILIAIEVITKKRGNVYAPVEKPIDSSLLGDYFCYDKENQAYTLLEKKKSDDSLFTVKENRRSVRRYLYENGFDVDGVHYVRYKRSAGSSRQGHCLFIAEPLYSAMMDWSLCGIDPDSSSDQASLQAYISLTLSSIKRKLWLPRQSILIVKDQVSKFTDTVIKVSQNGQSLTATKSQVEVENKIWDGEALLDSSVFEENGYASKGMMLLRNRFFKTCAFNTNLQKWFKDNGITKPSQLNGYYSKKTRSISDIKLVITESSLKYLKFKPKDTDIGTWFEKWLDEIYIDKEQSMFGIVKTDKPTGPMKNRMVRTNYQLLNTLALSRTQVDDALRDSLDFLKKMLNDPMYLRYHMNLFVADEYDEQDQSTAFNYRQMLISDIMRRTDNFEKTLFYRNFRSELCQSYKESLKRGRIMINGGYHTLLGNGLELLQAVIDKDYVVDEPLALKDGEIYSPRFEIGERLLCQRSPHITMGNLLVAENKRVEAIDKYFNLGEAKSIVCVNAIRSNIQQRLNGCDYDSDAMLITNHPLLLGLASNSYEQFSVPYCDVVPSGVASYTTSPQDLAELDIRIAENKIGEIVNLSQFLNSLYWEGLSKNAPQEALEDLYIDICKLAVLSGMEIDKAKRLFGVSADAVLTELRSYKDDYKELNDGQIPEFFAFITKDERSDNVSEDLSMCTALSYIFDRIESDTSRASRTIEPTAYCSLFSLDFEKGDPTGAYSKRIKSILSFVEEKSNRIRKLNFIKNTKNRTERDLVVMEIEGLFNECKEKISSVAKNDDYIYYLLLKELDRGAKSSKGVSKFNALLFASMCYANDGYLLKRLKPSEGEMLDLILLDAGQEGDVYVFGQPHAIGRRKYIK